MSLFVDKWPGSAFGDSNLFGPDSFHSLGSGSRSGGLLDSSFFKGSKDGDDFWSEAEMRFRNFSPSSATAGRGFYDHFDSVFHDVKSRHNGVVDNTNRRHYGVAGRDAARHSTSAKGKEFVIPIKIETSTSSSSGSADRRSSRSDSLSFRNRTEKEQSTASQAASSACGRVQSGRSDGRVIHIPVVRVDSTHKHGPDDVNSMWSKKSRTTPVWTPTTDENKSRHITTTNNVKDDDVIYLDSDFFFPPAADTSKSRNTPPRYRNAAQDPKYADYSDYDIIEIEEQEEEEETVTSLRRKPLRHLENNDALVGVTSSRNSTSSSSDLEKSCSAELSESLSRNDAAHRHDAKHEEKKTSELDEVPTEQREPWRCSHSGVTNVATPPSYPIYAHLKPRLASIGRQVDYIRGDGNCFFRALSKEMYGSEDYHAEWRQAVCDVIGSHPHVFAQYIDDSSVARHTREMRQAGTWATTCEIYATASLLQREIYVLVPAPNKTTTTTSPSATSSEAAGVDDIDSSPASASLGVCEYHWLLFSPRSLTGSSAGGSLSRLDKDSGRGGRGGGGGGGGGSGRRHNDAVHPCYLTLCHTNGNHYDRIIPVFARCNCEIDPPGLNGVSVLLDLTTSDEEELMQE